MIRVIERAAFWFVILFGIPDVAYLLWVIC